MLEVVGLTKRYASGDEALRGVSLAVEADEVVFVIGPSGAGKSTLIRCINRLVEPDAGSVKLDGCEITTLAPAALKRARRQMGMIFQEFNFVERLSVMENVLTGRLGYVPLWQAWRRRFPAEDLALAFDTLRRVGLEGMENKRADALSGGQRQRVGIARALVQRPKILLVDEPTSSLDPKTAEAVMALMTQLAAEDRIPALVNIHDVPLARRFARRIIGLNAGRVVFEGRPGDLDGAALDRIYAGAGAELAEALPESIR